MRDLFEKSAVDLEDDLQMARQHVLQQIDGPLLERLGHERVIGVSAGGIGDLPGAIPVEIVLVHQHAHQLGDGEGRVRVIELDGDLVRKLIEAGVVALIDADDVAHGTGDQKILLNQTQLPAGGDGIAGVEHLGNRLGLDLFLDGADVVAVVEDANVEFVGCAGREQA